VRDALTFEGEYFRVLENRAVFAMAAVGDKAFIVVYHQAQDLVAIKMLAARPTALKIRVAADLVILRTGEGEIVGQHAIQGGTVIRFIGLKVIAD